MIEPVKDPANKVLELRNQLREVDQHIYALQNQSRRLSGQMQVLLRDMTNADIHQLAQLLLDAKDLEGLKELCRYREVEPYKPDYTKVPDMSSITAQVHGFVASPQTGY